MKYTLVKQFSNSAIDNIFEFGFKIVDFGKIFWETMVAFTEIWVAFFLIFYNFFMYFYYLILFALDWGTESNTTVFFWRRSSAARSRAPSVVITRGPNPVPSMYVPSKPKVVESALSAFADTASSVGSTVGRIKSSPSGAKRSIIKTILQLIVDFFGLLKKIILGPVKMTAGIFEKKMKPVRDDETKAGSRSLIAEYMKEYEGKRS